jgi:hypothetical protein
VCSDVPETSLGGFEISDGFNLYKRTITNDTAEAKSVEVTGAEWLGGKSVAVT